MVGGVSEEVVLSVRVPVEVRDALRLRAEQEDRSMAAVLRRAMRAYVAVSEGDYYTFEKGALRVEVHE